MRRKIIAVGLIICLVGCSREVRFDEKAWKQGGPEVRNQMVEDIYRRNIIDTTMTKNDVIELLGEPEYDLGQGRPSRVIGYDILGPNDLYRGYHWFDVHYDTATLRVEYFDTRDD